MILKDEASILEAVAELKAFEQEVAEIFNRGEIRAPVHLAGGNERQLINIFKWIKPQDWVFSTWRSHYHCILKDVPKNQLLDDIRAGRSITLCYPKQHVLCSAIVGGVLPIATGLAWSIKQSGSNDKVWVFVGDMTAMGGMFAECTRYALGHQLPISFVVEENGLSVCTDTKKVWGDTSLSPASNIHRYEYYLPWPHSGAGRRIEF